MAELIFKHAPGMLSGKGHSAGKHPGWGSVSYRKAGGNMIPEDPAMLLSFINLKLRDYYPSLDALCEDLDVDREEITEKLSRIDYHYDRDKNQFL